MTKKKTEDFEVAMNVTEVNDEQKKEVLNASEELYEEIPIEEAPATDSEAVEPPPKKKRTRKKKTEEPADEVPEEPDVQEVTEEKDGASKRVKRVSKEDGILTINAGDDVQTEEELAEIAWHEIHNAFRTRKILTGMFGGIEQTEAGIERSSEIS